MRRVPLPLLMPLAASLLAIVVFEVVLCILDYPSAYRIPKEGEVDPGQLIHQKSSIPGLGYELRLSSQFPYHTNILGLRDTITTIDKPANTRRIICIGDSFTYGLGVAVLDCYSKRLEYHLARTCPGWQVINMGVGGYASRDEACVLRSRAPRFDPDLVIVGYALNDPDTEITGGLYNFFSEHPRWHRVHLLRLLKGVYRRAMKLRWGGYERFLHNDARYWSTVQEAFRSMRESARELNAPIILVIFPVPARGGVSSWKSYRLAEIHHQVAEEGLTNGFEVLDLLPYFQGHSGDTLRVSATDGHPSPFAHDRAARILADLICKKYCTP